MSEAMAVFAKTEQALPCSRLTLTAHEFSDLVSGRGSIASFLRTASKPAASRAPDWETSSKTTSLGPGKDRGSTSEACGGGAERDVERNLCRGRAEADPQDGRHNRTISSEAVGKIGQLHRRKDTKPPSPQSGQKQCHKCGEVVAEGDLREHLDFHYAEGLQERYSREGDFARDMAKRKRPGEGGGAKRQTKQLGRRGSRSTARIDSFFKPT